MSEARQDRRVDYGHALLELQFRGNDSDVDQERAEFALHLWEQGHDEPAISKLAECDDVDPATARDILARAQAAYAQRQAELGPPHGASPTPAQRLIAELPSYANASADKVGDTTVEVTLPDLILTASFERGRWVMTYRSLAGRQTTMTAKREVTAAALLTYWVHDAEDRRIA